MKLTGVSGVISAAHYSRDGKLHGHTWQVVVWWLAESSTIISADTRKRLMAEYLERFDHKILPNELAWGEDLAEQIGLDLAAISVDVSRPLEGVYAKWERGE